MRIRTKLDLDDHLDGRADTPGRRRIPARDIVAALLLTLAAVVFIGVAHSSGKSTSEPRRVEAASGQH